MNAKTTLLIAMMTVCLTGIAQHRVCNAPRTVFMGWQEQQQVNRDIYEMLLKDSLIDDGDTLNIYPVFWRSFDRFN